MTGVIPFIIRRLLVAIPVLIVVSALSFWLFRFAPGDPVTSRAGPRANPEQIERVKQNLGLNDPIPVQYLRYMGNLLRGDLGESYRRPGISIGELIKTKVKVSLQLNILPLILIYLIGLPIGIYMALRRGSWQDPSISATLLLLAAVPSFTMIPFLQWLFALKLGWLPVGGWDGLFSTRVILPTIALTVPSLAGLSRLTRISLVQVLGEDFIRTARAKGLTENIVITRHTLRNAMLPLTTGVIISLFYLYTGTLFVELLFGIPGLGREAYESIGSRDYDMLMALTMISAAAFVLANLVLDIVYTIVDPRIRISGGSTS